MTIKLNMTPDDFIVIGPIEDDDSQVNLGDLFFQRYGDIIVPSSEEGSFYEMKKNMEFFIFPGN